MKARFVFENIDFERGQDPKKAMGLGPKEYIWNWAAGHVFMEDIITDIENDRERQDVLNHAIGEGENDYIEWILQNIDGIDPNYDQGYPLKTAIISSNFEALDIIERHGGDINHLNSMVTYTPKEIKKFMKAYQKFKKKKLNASR